MHSHIAEIMQLHQCAVLILILLAVTFPSLELVFGKLQNGWPSYEILLVQAVPLQSYCRRIEVVGIFVKVAVLLVVGKQLMIMHI